MNELRTYARADVESLARAVIETAMSLNDGGRNAIVECVFCDARRISQYDQYDADWARIEHSSDCPFPIAKDVLT